MTIGLIALAVWTGLGVAWWVLSALAIASARHRPRVIGEAPSDATTLTVFKPLPRIDAPAELQHLTECLETFVCQLDERSELLIGCHRLDEPLIAEFVEAMRHAHPRARVKVITHPSPDRFAANAKISWMRLLAPHATGQLWLWSDSDISAPVGALDSLRRDWQATGAGVVSSPYTVETPRRGAGLPEALFVNLEFYPGVVVLDRLDLMRFGFGSGMLFEARRFHERIDWDDLGSRLADDYHLGRALAPIRLGSMRLSTRSSATRWKSSLLHYLRWKKTVRWSCPLANGLQLLVLPALGWLSRLLADPGDGLAWSGLALTVGADAAAAWTISRLLGISLEARLLPLLPVWSLVRSLSWVVCWLPWPVVWRRQLWWSPLRFTRPVTGVIHPGIGPRRLVMPETMRGPGRDSRRHVRVG